MINNNLKFTYTNYATLEKNSKKVNYINCPKKISYLKFLRNTSIGTSTMMVEKKILGNIKFTNTKICEDFFLNAKF